MTILFKIRQNPQNKKKKEKAQENRHNCVQDVATITILIFNSMGEGGLSCKGTDAFI